MIVLLWKNVLSLVCSYLVAVVMGFCCPATPHVCDPYCSFVYVFCVIFDEHYAVQELADVKRRVKVLQTGPRHFEHILLNPPVPSEIQRSLFQV